MCGKSINTPFRDREFDSLVTQGLNQQSVYTTLQESVNTVNVDAEAVRLADEVVTKPKHNCAELHRQLHTLQDNAETPVHEPPATKNPGIDTDIFQGARATLATILRTPNKAEQARIANEYINKLLTPYYQGRGSFNHEQFLVDLAQSKGRPLEAAELRFFGSIVGNWTADKVTEEFDAAVKRNDGDEVQRIFSAALSTLLR